MIFLKKNKKIILTFLIVFCLATPCLSSAQGLKNAGATLGELSEQGVGLEKNFSTLTNTLLITGFSLLATLFLGLMVYGGIVWLKSAGRDEEVTRARKIITTAIIGLIVLLSSYAITRFVLWRLSGDADLTGGALGGSGSSEVDKSSLGCCMSTANTENVTPMTESECRAKGGAFFWSSTPCH